MVPLKRDRRAKGCPNPDCENNRNRVLLKAGYRYCPLCKDELVFVCSGRNKDGNCFTLLQDEGPDHVFCRFCDAKHPKDKILDRLEPVKDAVSGGARAVIHKISGAPRAAADLLDTAAIRKDEAQVWLGEKFSKARPDRRRGPASSQEKDADMPNLLDENAFPEGNCPETMETDTLDD